MALLAFHHSMRAEQRKPVKVLLNQLHRYPPAQNRVALGAIGSELRTVNIGMTIGAFLSNISENRLGVALRAGYFFVHPTKRVPRGVMVEFGYGTNRRPPYVRVAIFAGNVQGTVRTTARLPLGLRRAGKYKDN